MFPDFPELPRATDGMPVIATVGDPDAERDRRWFDAHPGERSYVRPPTPREALQTALPPGIRVLVIRTSDGLLARVMMSPPSM